MEYTIPSHVTSPYPIHPTPELDIPADTPIGSILSVLWAEIWDHPSTVVDYDGRFVRLTIERVKFEWSKDNFLEALNNRVLPYLSTCNGLPCIHYWTQVRNETHEMDWLLVK